MSEPTWIRQVFGSIGSTVTAGGLVFRGEPDGNLLALDAKTGEELWRFQTGFGADAPPVVYEVDGDQFVAIAAGGNQLQGSAYGDAVWVFSLNGKIGPLWAPPPPVTIAGPVGPIAPGTDSAARTRRQPSVMLTDSITIPFGMRMTPSSALSAP